MAKKSSSAPAAAYSLPSSLSMSRSLHPSVFGMYALGDNEDFAEVFIANASPVTIRFEKGLGVHGHAATAIDKMADRNIVNFDIASLPVGKPHLMIHGSIIVSPSAITPHQTNSPVFIEALNEFAQEFDAAHGFFKLAERYLMNIFNGRILQRNRVGSNLRAVVRSSTGVEARVTEADLAGAMPLEISAITNKKVNEAVAELANLWADILAGKKPAMSFDVRVAVEMGEQQEVFPSQEFPSEVVKERGRILARSIRTDDTIQAGIHARKIGNALRTIDNWYKGATRPLAIEPFAPDLASATAHRVNGDDFYSLVKKMPELTASIKANGLSNEALFVAAMFVRGGLFSNSAEKVEAAPAGEDA